MAAESGKWAAKHTQNPPEKETIVENDPRPQSGSTPPGRRRPDRHARRHP
ncbi:hypothetical protein MTP02_04250 [Streptomyces albus]|nr:hypothetical protein MTP02_04250 [Streptomyces albus]